MGKARDARISNHPKTGPSGAMVDDQQTFSPRRGRSWLVWMPCALGCVILLVIWWSSGLYFVEKILTNLVLPCGAIWVGIGVIVYLSLVRRQKLLSVISGGLFVLYTFAGNMLFGDIAVKSLENRFREANPFQEKPFDLLIVLGGGTDNLESGTVQLNSNGDRIMLAARLFHLGKAKQLVATGGSYSPTRYDPLGGAQSAAEIWRDLRIPPDAITMIAGRNTSDEMRQLQALLQRTPAARAGLLTSAWHLPRALRLARREGLDVVPVAADFHTGKYIPLVLSIVPTADGFNKTGLAVKEYLAFAVGR